MDVFDIKKVELTMAGLLEHTVRNFSTLKVGVARSDLLDTVQVENYGQFVPIKRVATVSVADNSSLSVRPFDKHYTKDIIKAIQEANLGVGVIAEADSIRISIPKVTEERRKDYVKILKKYAEDGRAAIRGARRDANEEVKKAKKDSNISEDDARRFENDIQKLTDKFIADIDTMMEKKEKEILTV